MQSSSDEGGAVRVAGEVPCVATGVATGRIDHPMRWRLPAGLSEAELFAALRRDHRGYVPDDDPAPSPAVVLAQAVAMAVVFALGWGLLL